jgi:hypothetical protein
MLKSRERFLRPSATSHAPSDQARRAALALALLLAPPAKARGSPATVEPLPGATGCLRLGRGPQLPGRHLPGGRGHSFPVRYYISSYYDH